jgi:protein disulfide-isomerase A1
MRFAALSASLALAALVAAEGASEAATDVLALTTAEFDKAIAEEPLMLLEFYAPW